MTTAGIWANCPSDERWGSAAPTPMQAQYLELSARMGAERESTTARDWRSPRRQGPLHERAAQ